MGLVLIRLSNVQVKTPLSHIATLFRQPFRFLPTYLSVEKTIRLSMLTNDETLLVRTINAVHRTHNRRTESIRNSTDPRPGGELKTNHICER